MILSNEILVPAFRMERSLPRNLVDADHRYFEREITRSCPDVTLLSCKNALLDVHQGVVIDRMKVCPESLVSPALVPSYGLPYVLRARLRTSRKISTGPFLLVHTSYCEGYGHWMSDAIPRLFVVRNRLRELRLLLPSSYTRSFYRDSLLPFGIEDESRIHYEQERFCRFDHLVCPMHVGPSFCNVNDGVLQGIRKLYHEYFDLPRTAPTRRLYVSRAKVARRFVENEDKVTDLLKRYDFEVVHFQEYEFLDQIRMAAESEIMIGLTGSGLNNMMFMHPGSKVLELKMKGDYQNLHYFGFSSGLQLEYYYQICDTIGKTRFDANFLVNLTSLEKVLEQMARK